MINPIIEKLKTFLSSLFCMVDMALVLIVCPYHNFSSDNFDSYDRETFQSVFDDIYRCGGRVSSEHDGTLYHGYIASIPSRHIGAIRAFGALVYTEKVSDEEQEQQHFYDLGLLVRLFHRTLDSPETQPMTSDEAKELAEAIHRGA